MHPFQGAWLISHSACSKGNKAQISSPIKHFGVGTLEAMFQCAHHRFLWSQTSDLIGPTLHTLIPKTLLDGTVLNLINWQHIRVKKQYWSLYNELSPHMNCGWIVGPTWDVTTSKNLSWLDKWYCWIGTLIVKEGRMHSILKFKCHCPLGWNVGVFAL